VETNTHGNFGNRRRPAQPGPLTEGAAHREFATEQRCAFLEIVQPAAPSGLAEAAAVVGDDEFDAIVLRIHRNVDRARLGMAGSIAEPLRQHREQAIAEIVSERLIDRPR
jgi:hypothetical protein